MYNYQDGSKKNLNIKTNFCPLKYEYNYFAIELQDDTNLVLNDVLNKIDKKITDLITTKNMQINEYNYYQNSVKKIFINMSGKPNNINKSKIIKYNSKTYIKTMENKSINVPSYNVINDFSLIQLNEFMKKQLGKHPKRCENYVTRYLIYPKIHIYKNKDNKILLSSKMGMHTAEIKHIKSSIKSIIDRDEVVVTTKPNDTVYI
jgi:hypothetical protein